MLLRKFSILFVFSGLMLLCAAASSAPSKGVAGLSSDAQSVLASVDKATQDAFLVLLDAEMFQDKAVGFGGSLSEGVEAFQTVYKSDKAEALFTILSDEASLAGRLYGVTGLRNFDKAAFDGAVKSLQKHSKDTVQTQAGCLVMQDTVGNILENPAPNAIRLKPGQTVMAWLKLNGGGQMDIVGGAYSQSFSEGL